MINRNTFTINKLTLAIVLGFLIPFATFSNNIRITNVVNTNPGDPNPILTFDIAWDNSWRVSSGTNNYDAVWLFVKAQKVPVDNANCESYLEWNHANMVDSDANFSADSLLRIQRVGDHVGVFLYRDVDGIGSTGNISVQIQLDLPVPTAPYAPEYNFKVFGIEMVHIPQGAFELGDGSSTNTFNSIEINNSTSTLTSAQVGGNVYGITIPAAFPKGYEAFHVMKYEITQQQYVDFLNTLTFSQQVNRTALSAAQLVVNPGAGGLCAMEANCLNRNSIKLIQEGLNNSRAAVFACDLSPAPGDAFNSANDGQSIAMNYLSYADFYAYLDWAGLRSMTNFEFEKISRGPISRVSGEYIWGTTNITEANSGAISNSGQNAEVSNSSGPGLSAHAAPTANGPLRVGFSATASTSRETSGAAFYGVMNMGGNVSELVTGGTANGGYTLTYSNLGDGNLTAAGAHNTPNWLITSSQQIRYSGTNCGNSSSTINSPQLEPRGGAYNSPAARLRISDRGDFNGCVNYTDTRRSTIGGRGVR